MKPTWILIANAARARLLQQDAAGRLAALQSVKHAASPQEHMLFAMQLAQLLEQGAREQRYQALHVFAASPFLGEVEGALGPAARDLLAGAHDVDLTAVGQAELPLRMEHELT